MRQDISIFKFSTSQRVVSEFSNLLCKKFGVTDLEFLHKSSVFLTSESLSKGTDQATPIHKFVYREFDKDLDSPLVYSYRLLAKEWVSSLSSTYHIDAWAVQRFPSLRVHFPDNISVFEFHRDSDYRHPLGELNHFLSLTSCFESAALQVEKNLGWNDFSPLNLNIGESAILNTSIFRHGDYLNEEGYTRLSIDFRAIPIHVLNSQPTLSSLTKGRSFNCSDYFIDSCNLFEKAND